MRHDEKAKHNLPNISKRYLIFSSLFICFLRYTCYILLFLLFCCPFILYIYVSYINDRNYNITVSYLIMFKNFTNFYFTYHNEISQVIFTPLLVLQSVNELKCEQRMKRLKRLLNFPLNLKSNYF